MKLESLTEGQVVYEVGKSKMGNTTMRTTCVWPVMVIRIDLQARTVFAKWNNNPVREYRERTWKKWRVKKPILVNEGFGQRLATREELKAIATKGAGAL